MDPKAALLNTGRFIKNLALNQFFWGGLLVLLLLGVVGYFTVDRLLMPAYTRHDSTTLVPDVRNMQVAEAEQLLASLQLRVETETVRRLKPNVPINAVVDQNPVPNVPVKAGRRVYLTVNAGSNPDVVVRDVTTKALRQAGNELRGDGLRVVEKADPVPSPHRGAVTRTDPPAGTTLKQGDIVTVYYSTGLGQKQVAVPNVVGMRLADAEAELRAANLRSVTVRVGGASFRSPDDTVAAQGTEPGTSVREGFVVRLYPQARSAS